MLAIILHYSNTSRNQTPLHRHFEWQGRPRSRAIQRSTLRAHCHAGKLVCIGEPLGPVETLCILGVNVKSLLVLVRKELANCSAVLTLHRPWSFLPLKMAA